MTSDADYGYMTRGEQFLVVPIRQGVPVADGRAFDSVEDAAQWVKDGLPGNFSPVRAACDE